MFSSFLQPGFMATLWNIGSSEIAIILVIVLLIFGPKNLPKLASSIGQAIREFKDGMKNISKDIEGDSSPEPKSPEPPPAPKPPESETPNNIHSENNKPEQPSESS